MIVWKFIQRDAIATVKLSLLVFGAIWFAACCYSKSLIMPYDVLLAKYSIIIPGIIVIARLIGFLGTDKSISFEERYKGYRAKTGF